MGLKERRKMATRETTNPKVDKKIYHNTAATTKAINLAGKKRYRGGIRL